jgi:hypothetical protein
MGKAISMASEGRKLVVGLAEKAIIVVRAARV